MVLAKLYTDRIREEAREEGRQAGIEEGRQVGREEGREEGRQEGRAEGRQEGRAEGRQEGRAEGRQEGARLMLTRWQEWNRRRQAAEQAGHPFNEPEPNLD